MATGADELKIGNRTLRLSNLDKVFYPKTGFTKGDLIQYYIEIAPVLLPHIKDRPITLKRYPDGVEGEFFYQKECPPHHPDWLEVAPVPVKERVINFCTLSDLPSLVWAANIADIELHPLLSKKTDVRRPTSIAFDLDPGAPADVRDCARVALHLREVLREHGLESYPKTSGSKGFQVYAPLNTPITYDTTKEFARLIARLLEAESPKKITSNMSKALRTGKVFVDWSQNDEHKTTVSVYSLRARDRPTVSTPMQWKEVEDAVASNEIDRFVFLPNDVLGRVERHGDLFERVQKQKQTIGERPVGQKASEPPNPSDSRASHGPGQAKPRNPRRIVAGTKES